MNTYYIQKIHFMDTYKNFNVGRCSEFCAKQNPSIGRWNWTKRRRFDAFQDIKIGEGRQSNGSKVQG